MYKNLSINDPGFSKYKSFCLKYYPNIYEFFLTRAFDITWFNLCQLIYLGPNIVRYYDKYKHSNMQLLPTLYSVQSFEDRNNLGDIVCFFNRLFNSFEPETAFIDTRYNILKNMMYSTVISSNDKLFLIVKCQESQPVPLTIGNIKFLMKTSSIDTFEDMIKMLRNEFKMEEKPLLDSIYEIDRGSGFVFMCKALKINPMRFKAKSNSQIKTIISDFLHISQYRYKEQIQGFKQLRKRICARTYFRFTNWKEIRSYKKYLGKIRSKIEQDSKNNFRDVEAYKIEDVSDKECNKYKINLKLNNGLHPDYNMFKFLVNLYLKIRNLDLRKDFDALYKVIEREKVDRKLIYLRHVFKDIAADFDVMWKQKGYVLLYNMENLFGYRCDKIKKDELMSQVKTNFGSDNDKYGERQKIFFEKYFEDAISWVQSSVGYSVLGKVQSNLGQMVGAELYYNRHLFFDADGVTHKKMEDSRNRKVIVSKTQFFSAMENLEPYFRDISPRFYDYNSVVIKREAVKDRIVVNTSLDTYVPLAKIEYILHKCLKGIGCCYSLLDDNGKTILYGRLLKYCMYNKYRKKKYILLPLDYSSYDTTITFDLIKSTLIRYGKLTPYSSSISIMVNYFEQMLKGEIIKFNELGTEYKYKYGVLSGWKITNLVESLLNFVVSYGVVKELNEKLEDIITMGDDLVLVLDREDLNEEQLKTMLERLSKIYEELGFKVHPIKNMIGYECIEFLRNYYNGLTVITYPLRSLVSLAYCKPTSHLEFNNYSNYKMVLDEFIYKNGAFMFYKTVYDLLNISSNSNIAKYGSKFNENPEMFNLRHVYKYEYKVNDKELITKSQLYKYYVSIFGVKNKQYVYSFLKNNVFSKRQVYETIEPRRARITGFNKKSCKFVGRIVNFFKHVYSQSRYPDIVFNVGDYFINEIAISIFEKDRSVINILRQVLDNSPIGLDRKINMQNGLNNVTRSNLKIILNGYKLRVWNVFYNSAIVKQIKRQLFNYIVYNRIITKKFSAENIINVVLNNVISSIYKELSNIYLIKINGERIPIYLSVA